MFIRGLAPVMGQQVDGREADSLIKYNIKRNTIQDLKKNTIQIRIDRTQIYEIQKEEFVLVTKDALIIEPCYANVEYEPSLSDARIDCGLVLLDVRSEIDDEHLEVNVTPNSDSMSDDVFEEDILKQQIEILSRKLDKGIQEHLNKSVPLPQDEPEESLEPIKRPSDRVVPDHEIQDILTELDTYDENTGDDSILESRIQELSKRGDTPLLNEDEGLNGYRTDQEMSDTSIKPLTEPVTESTSKSEQINKIRSKTPNLDQIIEENDRDINLRPRWIHETKLHTNINYEDAEVAPLLKKNLTTTRQCFIYDENIIFKEILLSLFDTKMIKGDDYSYYKKCCRNFKYRKKKMSMRPRIQLMKKTGKQLKFIKLNYQ